MSDREPANTGKIPDALNALDFCQPNEDGEIKLSLEQLFRALAALGHDRAQAIATDIALGNTASRWRRATDNRNSSILAHGVRPIGEIGFNEMKSLCSEFFGWDLQHQAHPVPPLNPRWLE